MATDFEHALFAQQLEEVLALPEAKRWILERDAHRCFRSDEEALYLKALRELAAREKERLQRLGYH